MNISTPQISTIKIILHFILVILIVYFIWTSGGMDSPFSFLFFFPLVTSTFYLNKNITRNIAIFITLAMVIMISIGHMNTMDDTPLIGHIIQTIFMAIISYYIYRIVVLAIQHKVEKEEASKRLGEMEQVDRLKQDFLSVAQHQLRTPLSGVKWVLESMKSDTTLSSDTISLLDAGLIRVKDSIAIINNMLKTVEDNSGLLTLEKEPTDIVGILQALIAELNFIALKKNSKVIFTSPQSLIIFADRDKLKAAINNIIDNALKYSPNSVVNVSIEENEKDVSVTVKDNGIGISKNDLPYVFERLHRGKNAVMIEPDESGVGLYTSKRIIDLHGGSISVVSDLGKGTTVKVALPK